jgi:DNA-binding response OmpR family regulator
MIMSPNDLALLRAREGHVQPCNPTPGIVHAAAPILVSTVAVLDDDADVATSIALSLTRAGYNTNWYCTGQALLKAASASPFDFLIADWCLRDCTAGATLATLRTLAGYQGSPVVVLSGNLCLDGRPASAELRDAIAELGLTFRSKPRTTAQLIADIQAVSVLAPT